MMHGETRVFAIFVANFIASFVGTGIDKAYDSDKEDWNKEAHGFTISSNQQQAKIMWSCMRQNLAFRALVT
jgi:hypothetical protein